MNSRNVVEQRPWSATLHVAPGRQAVLLVDNPEGPSSQQGQHLLYMTRRLPGTVQETWPEYCKKALYFSWLLGNDHA